MGDSEQREWWGVVQACIWISTRSDMLVQRVASPASTGLVPGGQFSSVSLDAAQIRATITAAVLGIHLDHDLDISVEAPIALAEKCRAGEITIEGRRRGSGSAEPIPVSAWSDLIILDADELAGRNGKPIRAAPADDDDKADWWSALRMNGQDVKRLWPKTIDPFHILDNQNGEGQITAMPSAKSAAEQPRRRGGRPAEWAWDDALAHLTAVANTPNGLPDVQADAERIVEKYFADRHEGNSPASSGIRDKVGKVYDAIAQLKAKPAQKRKV